MSTAHKLGLYLETGYAVKRHHDTHLDPDSNEGYTPMNLNNAALLVRDDITTVEVIFDPGTANTYTYILHSSITVVKDDLVLVEKDNGHPKCATVVKVDAEPQINVNSNTHYKWIIGNVTHMRVAVESEIKSTHTIAKALKQKQATNVREQILAQFGVTSAAELLKLGQDNAQSE